MDYARLADELGSKLGLDSPPIAISFVQAPPAGVPTTDAVVPSACTFWRHAEQGVFYAPAAAHLNCAVGAMVMGFDLPESSQQELMGLVQSMAGCGYLAMEEAARIPHITSQPAGIVHGPLGEGFPLPPDVVLMWLTPRQAMLFAEAGGTSAWTAPAPTSALGRPACAVLPTALESGTPALSLGCAGMRTFTEISQERLLAVIPGRALDEFVTSLDRTLAANAAMLAFYEQRKAQLAPA